MCPLLVPIYSCVHYCTQSSPSLVPCTIDAASRLGVEDGVGLVVIQGLIELSRKSPCLHPAFGPAFTHYPSFQVVSAK
jgi:hypothetical protein